MQFLTLTALILISVISTSTFAKTYYVKNDGNDRASGTSHATAWKTISKVNSFKFAKGDDVYFKAGDTWNEALAIDWSGTSGNRVVIGSYYMNPKETIGVPSGTEKPMLRGGYRTNKNIGSVPSSTYRGLIYISASNYVTVQNFKVKDSSGYGITVGGTGGGHYAVIEKNDIIHTTGAAIHIYKDSHNAIIKDNTAIKTAWSINDGLKPKEYGSHPACFGVQRSNRLLIENNTISEYKCEGIGLVAANKAIIRGNTLVDGKHVAIYLDGASDTLIENNMILGNGSGKVVRMRGIAVAVERDAKESDSINNVIRNNVIAGVSGCFSTDMFQVAKDLGRVVGGKFIGNTCVGSNSAVGLTLGATYYTSWEVANNVFWDNDNGASACSASSDPNINMHHNSWATKPKDSDCNGVGDVYGNPSLKSTKNFRLLGFADADKNKATTVEGFKPTRSSQVIGAGALHAKLDKDYNNKLRASVSPTMGALLDTGNTTGSNLMTSPSPPTGLSISIQAIATP